MSKNKHFQTLKFTSLVDQDDYFILTKIKSIIGRSERCDLVLSNENVSCYQSIIYFSDQTFKIIDLIPINSTLLNNHAVQDSPIYPGDIITFGAKSFLVEDYIIDDHLVDNECETIAHKTEEILISNIQNHTKSSTLIDNEFCEIDVDTSTFIPSNELPLNFKNFKSTDYIDTQEEIQTINTFQDKNKIYLEVTFCDFGNIVSHDLYEFKNEKSFLITQKKKKTNEIEILNFEYTSPVEFIKFKNSKLEITPPADYIFNTNIQKSNILEFGLDEFDNDTFFSLTKGTSQIFFRPVKQEKVIRSYLFNFRDKAFYRNSLIAISSLLIMLSMLEFTPLKKPQPITKKIVFYKTNPNKERKLSENKKMLSTPKKTIKRKRSQIKKYKKNMPQRKVASTNVNKITPNKFKKFNFNQNKFKNHLPSTNINHKQISLDLKIDHYQKDKPGHLSKVINTFSRYEGKGQDFNTDMGRRKVKIGRSLNKKTVILGSIDPEILKKILREYIPQFKFCYQEELSLNEKIMGTLELEFRINKNGIVSTSNIYSREGKFSSQGLGCVQKVLSLIKFPRPKGGGIVDVKQPLNFISSREKI